MSNKKNYTWATASADNTSSISGVTSLPNYWANTTDTTTDTDGVWEFSIGPVFPLTPDGPVVELDKNEMSRTIYVTPDDLCDTCDKPLGMFCPKEHYIESDNEEYRFLHSLKCNEKLAILYDISKDGTKRHVYCP